MHWVSSLKHHADHINDWSVSMNIKIRHIMAEGKCNWPTETNPEYIPVWTESISYIYCFAIIIKL